MNPNERRATRSGAFSGATRRAGPMFPPAALSVACLAVLNGAPSALPDEKMAAGRVQPNRVSRPKSTVQGLIKAKQLQDTEANVASA